MKKIFKIVPFIIVALLVGVTAVYAGNLTPPEGPVTNTLHSLTDIYNLAIGEGPSEINPTLTTNPELVGGGKTLNEVYTAIADEIEAIDPATILTDTTIFGVNGRASAGTNYSLPKTDQTSCWSYAGSSISCTGTGQDGDLRKGFEGTRFANNDDGTTTDNATGLIWQRQDNDTKYLWGAALAYCNNNTAGLPGSGWRTPNIKELMSIANYQNASPAIDTTNFINTKSSQYWSNTTALPAYLGFAWTLNFDNGTVNNTDKEFIPQNVRCVR